MVALNLVSKSASNNSGPLGHSQRLRRGNGNAPLHLPLALHERRHILHREKPRSSIPTAHIRAPTIVTRVSWSSPSQHDARNDCEHWGPEAQCLANSVRATGQIATSTQSSWARLIRRDALVLSPLLTMQNTLPNDNHSWAAVCSRSRKAKEQSPSDSTPNRNITYAAIELRRFRAHSSEPQCRCVNDAAALTRCTFFR